MSSVKIVTGFVPLPDHPRFAEYERLGERLMEVNAPKVLYRDLLENCWLWKFMQETGGPFDHPVDDSPAKNTLAYMCIGHQKSEWVARAAAEDLTTDVFVWIDYGIFNLPGVTKPLIETFLERASHVTSLTIPGPWPDKRPVRDEHPHWRFCGGLIIAPRASATPFNDAVQKTAKAHALKTRMVPWEVNTWARIDNQGVPPIHWYQIDHNETMFTVHP